MGAASVTSSRTPKSKIFVSFFFFLRVYSPQDCRSSSVSPFGTRPYLFCLIEISSSQESPRFRKPPQSRFGSLGSCWALLMGGRDALMGDNPGAHLGKPS